MSESSLSLLNVFEVEVDGTTRHVLCFLDPVLAGAKGIDARWTIGELTPQPGGVFDASTFTLYPEFVATVTAYMNDQAREDPALAAQAAAVESQWLYVLDPRYRGAVEDAPASEVLGCFAVDETGQIGPGSFQYNRDHVWFERTFGASGLLTDRRFYDWLHPSPGPSRDRSEPS